MTQRGAAGFDTPRRTLEMTHQGATPNRRVRSVIAYDCLAMFVTFLRLIERHYVSGDIASAVFLCA